MTKTPKFFLTISIATFAVSLTEVGSNIGWGILRPVSAITFILFFITHLVAKEVALYDQEQRERWSQAKHSPTDLPKTRTSAKNIQPPATLEAAVVN